MSEIVVELKNIEKYFSGNRVLNEISFSLEKGTVHGLLGENGAGKSTLMNILGGIIPLDSGEIFIKGQKQYELTPALATEMGIAFIHQEMILADDLKVYENIFLGMEIKKGFFIDQKAMIEKSKEIFKSMGLDIDPKEKAGNLNMSYRQGVEIARALAKNAEIIIMDEPTSSLSEKEIQNVFSVIRALKNQGVSFVFISHKLGEVLEICDNYTVLRDGNVVKSEKITSDISEKEIAESMVGEEVTLDDIYKPRNLGKTVLEVRNLSVQGQFSNINFDIKKGEIIGFTGLMGDGRTAVFETILGCNGKYDGEILINDEAVQINSCSKAIKNGIVYLPSNRKENGVIKDMSIAKNISLSFIQIIKRFFIIDKKKEKDNNSYYTKAFSIKAKSLDDSILSLSGGNQQKALLARALSVKPKILILNNPAQGVDILAKYQIYRMIITLAQAGTSIFILSGEAQEVLNLCDKIYVMYEKKIAQKFSRDEASLQKIMLASTGVEVDK